MKVIISGIHGFVGSNIVLTHKSKHCIYGLDLMIPYKDGVEKTFTWLELNQLPIVDVIIHLAGKAHDTKLKSKAQTYFDINTGLTQKIYDYFLLSDAKKFVFFSSVKAAADSVNGDILYEDVIPAPKGPYGESKILAEKYIQANLPSPESGKRVYILRPCMIHGPGNKGNLNLLYKAVNLGLPWPLGAFENRRSFTSIDNLSYIINELISNDIASGIYNMADDEAVSTNELIEIICESMGQKAKIWHLPTSLINKLAAISGKIHLPLNPERLRKLTENYVVSNSKIKKALGIERMPVSAREGLMQTIKSFNK